MSEPAREPMRLLYLTKRFPRLSETFILEEIIGLEKNGIQVILLSIGDPKESLVQSKVKNVRSQTRYLHTSPTPKFTDGLGKELAALFELSLRSPWRVAKGVYLMATKRTSSKSFKHFLEGALVAKIAKQSKAEWLHGAFAHSPAAVVHYASILSAIPFSFAAHAKDLFTTPPGAIRRRANAARFLLCCSALADAEARKIAPSASVVYMPHGVDTTAFCTNRNSTDASDELRVACVGRLVPKKGIHTLIRAIALLSADGVEATLRICGSGELKGELFELACNMGVSGQVEFLGAVTHEEVAAVLKWADVYVQPSVEMGNGDRDGIPNAMLEAMSMAIAVVATEVAGIPEVVVDSITGLLVPPADEVAMSKKLRLLALDPSLRDRLGRAGAGEVRTNWNREILHAKLASLFILEARGEETSPLSEVLPSPLPAPLSEDRGVGGVDDLPLIHRTRV